jgi:hypothetical protein
MAGWSFFYVFKNLMRIATMEENWDKLTRRVWLELEKIYSGDRARMREAIDYICKHHKISVGHYWSTLRRLIEANYPIWLYDHYLKTIRICQDIKANWDNFTTELAPPPSPGQQKPESYNQLTLDFSVTTELSSLMANSRPRHNAPQAQEDGVMRSLTPFPSESIFLAISRQGAKKGWLSPQYKFKFDKKSSTTTRWDDAGKGRVWGPYWMFCWARPGGSDGHYYLGKVTGKKFQHFCEVWKSSHSLEEILRRLGVG